MTNNKIDIAHVSLVAGSTDILKVIDNRGIVILSLKLS